MNARLPGPGDAATWGPCLNHPMDPRTPEPAEFDDLTADEQRADLADPLRWTRDELVDLCCDLGAEAVKWKAKYERLARIYGIES